ncbi:GNAT family N-acetyltransferase [Solitalea koreensis]|uniref:Protein N-acetyltransferase, RimJ/RimL family n=1 Tax=Solitalea koreensis TaxID=543615 RepID=A0A521CJL7_9SPHI|nr:GNAT family N-acetyltransferase [Solitalea koreensis]SMO59653.1 Protein N-acetyltransferase, RimJ/RimL family [Solitalea koreensis]
MTETPHLDIVPFSEPHFEAIFSNDNIRLGELLKVETPNNWTTFAEAKEAVHFLYQTFKSLGDERIWGSYFIILRNERTLIGTGGFKGKPDNDNQVEIGYEINPLYRNKGFVTQAVQALIEIAFTNNAQSIKAHTLHLESPSSKVLKKCGFTFKGTINDTDDGPAWCWLLQKP